jgi:hypothetical protein
LSFGFNVSADGLSIAGLCPHDEEGVVCLDDAGPLVYDDGAGVTPVVSLVRALSPSNEILVPATAETDALLRVLPTAPLVAPRERVAAPPYSPVRLRDDRKRR